MTYEVEVEVTLKPVVNDPQGLVVRDGLRSLGFSSVRSARVGKLIVLEVDADDETTLRAEVTRMCERLLRNPVIEDYRIEAVRPLSEAAG